ncbi:MAG: carboxyl transferase domain-containing protein, partial [Bdellovibrionota bacterium]
MTSVNLVKVQISEHGVLTPLAELFTESGCDVLMPDGIEKFSRSDCDGMISAFGWIGNRQVGVLMNDFRTNGGSYGAEVSTRTARFLDLAREAQIPVVFLLNTLGVRFMEGRTVFKETFSI